MQIQPYDSSLQLNGPSSQPNYASTGEDEAGGGKVQKKYRGLVLPVLEFVCYHGTMVTNGGCE